MAGRPLQALSQALRRAWGSNRSFLYTTDVRLAPQVVEGPQLLSASASEWRTGKVLGFWNGCSVPGSVRRFSAVEIYNSKSLIGPQADDLGRGRTRVVSFSTLALETREEFSSNADEIGYKVLGPYVPDAGKIKPQATFAVVQVGSHQFKVSPGDMIYTEKLKYADINDQLSLNKVLLLGSLRQTIIGRPIIPEAAVIAAVEEHALDAKVIVFKKKRRKNYRRTNGHRQELTRLRILRIEGIEDTTPVVGEDSD